jgi:hypothetical protein
VVRKPEKESVVRTELIDKQLFQAGWSRSGGTLVDEFRLKPAPGGPSTDDQFADYVLLGRDGRVLGVVEAKRSSRNVLAGKRQASDYADLLREQFGLDPFIFLANGNEILFWDRDRYPPRAVSGFFTQDDLERLAHQKKYGGPAAWPSPRTDLAQWNAFKELMQGFYEKLAAGLPFDGAGNPVDSNGVTYGQFVHEFKLAHGDRVCVLCDGPFSGPQVDHWIGKAAFPLLAIAPHNMLPICCVCNEPPAKGTKAAYTAGVAEAFKDWFHPYHYPGYGRVSMVYEITRLAVFASALAPADVIRVQHLDGLLNLSLRWTGTFKAEYRNRQKALRQLIDNGYLAATVNDLRQKLAEWKISLVVDEENFQVSNLVLDHALDPDSLNGWLMELTEGDAAAH